MSNRTWYYAAQGQQQGPISEAELRDLIARGAVTGETLVWSEGMAGWEKASAIPGLISEIPGGPPPGPFQAPPTAQDGDTRTSDTSLSAKLELWPYLGWALLFVLGELVVVLTPWTTVSLYRYVVERIRVPGRPNLSFTGQPLDIWYVLVGMALLTYVGSRDQPILQIGSLVAQALLSWMLVRWVVSKLASNGQPIPLSFEGSAVVYLGWYVLTILSAITIIGWAWVVAAWIRWICRNLRGSRREIVFTASGIDVLWRTIVLGFGCLLIIPIPWLLRWYTEWAISQFALVPRAALPA